MNELGLITTINLSIRQSVNSLTFCQFLLPL